MADATGLFLEVPHTSLEIVHGVTAIIAGFYAFKTYKKINYSL